MKKKKGFTLIEMLVVVLIIGILAGIALPQYNKAVWRTRAKGMLPVLRTMQTSIDTFYIVREVYPSKLEELDIDINELTNVCINMGAVYKSGGCKANERVNLFLNVVDETKDCTPMFQFNSGPYRGAGFTLTVTGKFYCYENSAYIEEKTFCEKVMGCNFSFSHGVDFYYLCPDL